MVNREYYCDVNAIWKIVVEEFYLVVSLMYNFYSKNNGESKMYLVLTMNNLNAHTHFCGHLIKNLPFHFKKKK